MSSKVELNTYSGGFLPTIVDISGCEKPQWTKPYLCLNVAAGQFGVKFLLSPVEAIEVAEALYREAVAMRDAEAGPELMAFELEPAA